jgi:hypothetical protein
VEILEYLTADGRSPYRDWFDEIDAHAAARVTVALTRMGLGNFSNAKGVALAFRSTGSITVRDIASTSAETARSW